MENKILVPVGNANLYTLTKTGNITICAEFFLEWDQMDQIQWSERKGKLKKKHNPAIKNFLCSGFKTQTTKIKS